jgi:enamine deaminase RidA (YjgF/YER057c/UK114 family)
MTPERRLELLGWKLPAPPRPLGEYTAVKEVNGLLFLSGMLPLRAGEVMFAGAADPLLAQSAARIAALNALALLRRHLGSLDRVRQVVRLAVHIQSAPGCYEHAFVADGASHVFNQVFAERGVHARLVFGAVSLPKNAMVELDLIVEAFPDEIPQSPQGATQ